ncbi:DNA cytosine methyltransferase [Methylorubrum extorquens]|jgi:DNA (cytosine-5)-methyltransferase 1|uniref:DNA (cytosine-5-)-methyltransferase n=1 Tax=Methylorubrum extorquens (strain ATCC 14718 / DSM 1338 / JCM 2805 / NCIMB 9133 / AM1) TaxID=272630 RepID=C5B5P2_METEA|nr:DNA cytosine methyltransferase [Methylorubrum extorquens]ACS43774.1 putative DNA methyltransferase [Methylorubrum extorquens AM1]MCP1546386.1 DNA (cytosine-5)-methyltransferase 1 [Methylorubrum extorquens]MCP1591053.1 DNA (cytosine-5)-methyltransferase 1 [Methylorubrum extorquens]
MCPDPGRAPTDVVDLFSGGGGMSCGFARTPGFRLVGAVDLERGKPSAGATGCNGTYKANIGIDPHRADLATLTPDDLREAVLRTAGVDLAPGRLGVLAACPPCTDFSRAKPSNHLVDGGRNDLVGRVGDFVEFFRPRHLVMENAREFLHGAFRHHSDRLRERLAGLGYQVAAEVATLAAYGLPQVRERALLVASRTARPRTPVALWDGYAPDRAATTVRSALGRLAAARTSLAADAMDRSPSMGPEVLARLAAVPHDGGS